MPETSKLTHCCSSIKAVEVVIFSAIDLLSMEEIEIVETILTSQRPTFRAREGGTRMTT